MSDPVIPPPPDWEELWRRSEFNRRRATLGMRTAIVGLVLLFLALGAAVPVAVGWNDVPDQARKTNEILAQLRHADGDRDALREAQTTAIAVVVENLAAAFNTPPAPDPGRTAAVENLCRTAKLLRQQAHDKGPAPPCP